MSVFTTVPTEALEPWLQGYAVGSLLELRGIASGVENTNYFLTTTHATCVLTLFENIPAAELPYFLELMDHLAAHGIPCPRPLANLRDEFLNELCGKPACLVTRLSGASVTRPDATACAELGGMLAGLHLAGQSFPRQRSNPRGPQWWKAVAAELRPHLGEDDLTLLREELRIQALFRLSDLPRGVIHADLFRDNVLFDAGRISGIIDFYYACSDAWLYDLAITANDWCLDEDAAPDRERLAALLGSYHRVRPLSAIERGAWPVMLRAGALRFWLSRLYAYHFPRPGELTHAKDPDHFRRVLQGHVGRQALLQRLWV